MNTFTPRKWQDIYASIIQAKQATAALNGLTSTSQTANWNLWAFIVAISQAFMEQRFAILQTQIENTVANAIVGTAAWIQAQVLKFQDGNVIQINPDFTFQYPLPSFPTPITSCAVVTSPSGSVSVKVAQGSYPQSALSGTQLTELTAYLSEILPAGLVPNIISVAADTLQINAVVYYNGQFNSSIQNAVQAALDNYMSLLQFNGMVKVSDIEKTILGVSGVVDVTFTQITCTPVAAGGNPVNLIAGSAVLSRNYQTYSGYLINAANPNDFPTTITYAVANQ